MEDKVIKSLSKSAKEDQILGMHISYYNNGELHQHNLGYSDNNKTELINNQTLFEIGSLSKPIIATIYSILQQNKTLSLESPVSYFFKSNYIHPIFGIITIENILTHTAGLPRLPDTFLYKMTGQEDPYSCLRNNDLYDFLKEPRNLRKKGKYYYSNLGYGILGEILRITTSKSIQALSKELIFGKINMNSTDIINNLENHRNKAQGHSFANQETVYWHNEVLAGAGCFLSSGDDMSKYLLENINSNGTDFSVSVHKTHIPVKKNIGLAWHIKSSFLSKLFGYGGYVWHSGMTGGFSSFLGFHKVKKVGLVLLANKALPLDSYFYKFSSYFIR